MRYLTEREKEKTLGYLRDAYKKASLDPDGHLDLEMIPYLERINACDGMVTLQSCTGHKKSKKRNYTFGGHLWIRLNKELTAIFDERLIALVKSASINQVEKNYSYYKQRELQETIVIMFEGHEADSFYRSIEFIAQFFWGLRERNKNVQNGK